MSGTGNASSGDGEANFWDKIAVESGEPSPPPRPVVQYLPAVPHVNRPLLEHLQPLFLYVCEQHRLAKARVLTAGAHGSVRRAIDDHLADLERAALSDPTLPQHLKPLRQPIRWFIDDIFATRENSFPFWQDWTDNRLEPNQVGGEQFFKELDRELEIDPRDDVVNERLAFYYTALGLGFMGCFFRPTTDHRRELTERMDALYPRVAKYLDSDGSGRITPEAYKSTKTQDFVVLVRKNPMLLLVAFLLMLMALALGYLHWYQEAASDLENAVNSVADKA